MAEDDDSSIWDSSIWARYEVPLIPEDDPRPRWASGQETPPEEIAACMKMMIELIQRFSRSCTVPWRGNTTYLIPRQR